MDLEQFNDAYDEAEEPENDFSPVPDGTYQTIVDAVELKPTKKTGEPMIAWTLRIVAGTKEGRLLFKNSVIKEDSLGYLKADLSICGVILKKFSDLDVKLSNLLDVGLEVKVVNKEGTYQGKPTVNTNVYFQKSIELSDDIKDDDIRF
jgi:hypothetical protein